MAQDDMGVVGRIGPNVSTNAIFRNPSEKVRLDESFRMVPVSCHLEVVVKSYGQNVVVMSRNKKVLIWNLGVGSTCSVFACFASPGIPYMQP